MEREVEQYRAFIANSAEGIWRFETDSPVPVDLPEDEQIDAFYRVGYMAECNDALARMYGFSRGDELIGARLGDLIPRATPQNIEYLRAFIRAGYRLTDVESVERDRDGREKRFANSLVGIVENGALVRAWGTQRDITEQRRLERELAQRERDYAVLVDNALDVLARYDRAKRIVYVNRAGERHAGAPASALLGKTFREAGFPEEIIPLWDAALDRVLQTGAPHWVEFTLRHPEDGDEHHYEAVLTPDTTGAQDEEARPSGVVALTRDVTERKKAQEAVRTSEARYRQLLDASVEGVLFIDTEERMTYANASMAKLLDYGSPAELVGRSLFDIFFEEDVPAARERRAMRRQDISEQYEVRLRRKDGSPCWALASIIVMNDPQTGAYLGTYAMSTDITDRKRAQMERERAAAENARRVAELQQVSAKQNEILRTVEEGFRLLVEQVEDYAIFVLDPEGYVATWNAGAQRFTGYASGEIIGQHFSRFYTKEDIDRRHPWHELEIAAREGRYEEEGWRLHKDGSRFWASVVIAPLRGPGGTLLGFGKVTRDMTEQRRREQERAAAELLEQQRRFLKDVLASVTQGRLILCDSARELPALVGPAPVEESIALTRQSLKAVRTRAAAVAAACGLPTDRTQDLVTAVSECAMNAVQHAGGGTAQVYGDPDSGTVQALIEDRGKGIDLSRLPRATLDRSYSTGGMGFGHGFWLMLQTCDHVYLLTGPSGTTVVLEQHRTPADPPWMQAALK